MERIRDEAGEARAAFQAAQMLLPRTPATYIGSDGVARAARVLTFVFPQPYTSHIESGTGRVILCDHSGGPLPTITAWNCAQYGREIVHHKKLGWAYAIRMKVPGFSVEVEYAPNDWRRVPDAVPEEFAEKGEAFIKPQSAPIPQAELDAVAAVRGRNG